MEDEKVESKKYSEVVVIFSAHDFFYFRNHEFYQYNNAHFWRVDCKASQQKHDNQKPPRELPASLMR